MDRPISAMADPNTDEEVDVDIDVEEGSDLEDIYKILIHNDDATPMQFVIAVLVKIFERPLVLAEAIMWEAHQNGNAVVMAEPKKQAEARVGKAHFAARLDGYPLTFTIEPA